MYNGIEQTNALEGLLAGASITLVILAILGALILCALGVLLIISYCKLFKKAGEAWWKALIPLYNSWIETKISGLAWWWFIIITVLGAVVLEASGDNYILSTAVLLTSFNYSFNLAKKFGKTNGFAVLMTFLPVVGFPILAFGNAKYNPKTVVDENGIFSIKK